MQTIHLVILLLIFFILFVSFLDYNNHTFNKDRYISMDDGFQNLKEKVAEFKGKPKKIPKIPFTNRLQKIQLSNDFIYLSKTQISL